jgi:hypothetical protein
MMESFSSLSFMWRITYSKLQQVPEKVMHIYIFSGQKHSTEQE